MHVVALAFEYQPAEHTTSSVPPAHELPAWQGMHNPISAEPAVVVYVPGAQLMHDVAPTLLHLPIGQIADKIVVHDFPAEHCVHVEVPVAME